MSGNRSTIWAQLSDPLAPAGAIGFVGSDNVTLETDVTNLFYCAAGFTLGGSLCNSQLTVSGGFRVSYTDTTATPGDVTINKPAGRVAIAPGNISCRVSSSYCFASSIIKLQLESRDQTFLMCVPVPGAGGFDIVGNNIAAAQVTISYEILNVY